MSATGPPVLRSGAEVAPGYAVIDHVHRSRDLDVYDVWDGPRACRAIAKTLRPDRRARGGARRRLLREGELLTALCHPHLVRGYELVREPDPLVIMETLTGETLTYAVEEHGTLPAEQLGQLGFQLCSAVAYLHGNGVLHLDLKPSNVVAECGRAKLVDLSLARPPGSVRPGVGTWCYLAPEQARGGPVDAPADIWGIGAVLWEAAVGRPPFDDDDVPSVVSTTDGARASRPYAQLRRPAVPVAAARREAAGADDELPGSLAEAIDACLQPAPGDRPSVGELAAHLEAGLSASPRAPRPLA